MPKILAIDLGTTYFKFALIDRDGRLRDTCQLALPLDAAEPGRMEMSAAAFSDTIARGIATLGGRDDRQLADVEAVSLATQTNSFILLDSGDCPLTPIILWPDHRAEPLEAETRQRCAGAEFSATTGIPQLSHQFMLAKLLWLQRNSPRIWEQMRRLCLISDYLTLLLTGSHVTEAGTAGLTGLVDIHRCQWWPDMLDRFELEPAALPAIARAGTDFGPIDPRAARRFGLPLTCRFVTGCLDQYAGAIGVGNVEAGGVSETTGTVLATVQCADQFSTQLGPAVFQGPAFREGLYWRMVFSDVSANLLQAYRDQLPDRPEFDRLIALAEPAEPGPTGHAVRCILEKVAAELADQVAALDDGSPPSLIRCAGGGARSDLWLQIKADMLGVATAATESPEPTSLGAAMLAEAALRQADLRQIAAEWVRLKPIHRPDPERPRHYAADH